MLGEERPIISLLPSSHVLLQASARFLQVLGRRRSMHAWVTLENLLSICKWIEHLKEWINWCANHTMLNKWSPIATYQESFLDTCHINCCQKNLSRSQFPYGRFIHPPHFKTQKNHSCRSPIFHCLCIHHNRFISHHYYVMTSHILSTFEFHVGSIFHYDSSQSFIWYRIGWCGIH